MGKITSAFVIGAINEFSQTIKKKTVICLDKCTHPSFQRVSETNFKLKALDLEIFYLPKYSPNLNSIEILWRKTKHEWLRAKHYLSFETLEKALEGIFLDFGNIYSIDFK